MSQIVEFVVAHAELLSAIVTAVGSLLVAWLKHRRADVAERVVGAVVAGVVVGLRDVAAGKPATAAICDGIEAAAVPFGVEEHVVPHVDAIAASPSTFLTSPTVPPPRSKS